MTPQEAILAKIAAKAATAADFTKTTSGGGDTKFEPPAAGPCRLRLVSYVEIGVHEKTFKGQSKKQDRCRLAFEVSGPKHPPREVDGKSYPHMVYVEETLSRHEKANFVKLFNQLNYDQTATHPAQCVGKAYLGTIVHRAWKKKDDPADPSKWTGLDVGLRNDTGYTIRAPRFEDPETGDLRVVEVAPPVTPLTFFLWSDPDMDCWNSIFIDGEYPERKDEKTGKVIMPAKSKNVVQAKIISALNFEGSAIHTMLAAGGKAFDFKALAAAAAEDAGGPADSDHPANAKVDEDDALAGVAATTPARTGAPDLIGPAD